MINVPNLAQSPLLNKNLNNKPQPPVQKQNAQAPKTTHTSWLYINDVHGKMTNMERIYNMTEEFDRSNPKAITNFYKDAPQGDISKFKVSSGDIILQYFPHPKA